MKKLSQSLDSMLINKGAPVKGPLPNVHTNPEGYVAQSRAMAKPTAPIASPGMGTMMSQKYKGISASGQPIFKNAYINLGIKCAQQSLMGDLRSGVENMGNHMAKVPGIVSDYWGKMDNNQRNALIGGGVGAGAGMILGGPHKRRNALIGAAMGGAGGYAIENEPLKTQVSDQAQDLYGQFKTKLGL